MKILTCNLLIFLALTSICSAGIKPCSLPVTKGQDKKELLRLQKLLNQAPSQANILNKNSSKEYLIEFYSLNWNGSAYTDTSIKTVINRDAGGNPLSLIDYPDSLSQRNIFEGLLPSAIPSEYQSFFNFYYLPTRIVSQTLAGKSWVTYEIDSFSYNSFGQMTKKVVHFKAVGSLTMNKAYRVSPINGYLGSFELDTLAGSKWNKTFQERTDSVYDAGKHLTRLNFYLPDSTGSLSLQLYENYKLNARGEPVSATRAILNHKKWLIMDSFINISWLSYSNTPLNLVDNFQFIAQVVNYWPPTILPLFTGGNHNTSMTTYAYDNYTDSLLFYSSSKTYYTPDSLPAFVFTSNYNGSSGSIDSVKYSYSYYTDKTPKNDSIFKWNGASWFLSQIDSNINTYDANSYLSTVTNKTLAAGRMYPNYENFYIYQTITGIAQASSSPESLHIFPNPANDVLYVKSTSAEAYASLKVLDLTGKVLCQNQFSASMEQQSIDISRFASGVYLLQYSSANTFNVKEFIKR